MKLDRGSNSVGMFVGSSMSVSWPCSVAAGLVGSVIHPRVCRVAAVPVSFLMLINLKCAPLERRAAEARAIAARSGMAVPVLTECSREAGKPYRVSRGPAHNCISFYLGCIAVTRRYYTRKMRQSLAESRVWRLDITSVRSK